MALLWVLSGEEAMTEGAAQLELATPGIPAPWRQVSKGHELARRIADQHYTRQNPGHPMWTRPGYNFVLLASYPLGDGLFCWWRPKWEDGRPGTRRKDGLRVLECTMFRRVGDTDLASVMIAAAVDALASDAACAALRLDAAGRVDGLITGVDSAKTASRRSPWSPPGACFRHAGWIPVDKTSGRADTWLGLTWTNPWAPEVTDDG